MKVESSIIYDTSALIEFLKGTELGEIVKESFLSSEIQNIIPAIVFAELISKAKRNGLDYLKFTRILENNCTVIHLTQGIAKKAGELHAKFKPKQSKISLIDCIILIHAEMESAKVLTKDKDFAITKNVKLLE